MYLLLRLFRGAFEPRYSDKQRVRQSSKYRKQQPTNEARIENLSHSPHYFLNHNHFHTRRQKIRNERVVQKLMDL